VLNFKLINNWIFILLNLIASKIWCGIIFRDSHGQTTSQMVEWDDET